VGEGARTMGRGVRDGAKCAGRTVKDSAKSAGRGVTHSTRSMVDSVDRVVDRTASGIKRSVRKVSCRITEAGRDAEACFGKLSESVRSRTRVTRNSLERRGKKVRDTLRFWKKDAKGPFDE